MVSNTYNLYSWWRTHRSPHFCRFFKPCAGFFSSVVWLGGRQRHSYCVHAQNTGIYSVFASLHNTLHKGCGTRHVVTSMHAFGDHAQNIGIYSVFVSLRDAGCGLLVNLIIAHISPPHSPFSPKPYVPKILINPAVVSICIFIPPETPDALNARPLSLNPKPRCRAFSASSRPSVTLRRQIAAQLNLAARESF